MLTERSSMTVVVSGHVQLARRQHSGPVLQLACAAPEPLSRG